ncbi:MAG: hypothetical protein LQ340_005417 [Diploschistes diacapsis]|nr:MAG: hypothetical protein LQ340_005417 [Diploschistes diacapsis]
MLVLCLILAFGYFSLRLVSWLLHKRRLRLLEEQRKRKDEEIQRRLDTRRERHRRLLLERARQFKAEQEQRAREQEARKLEDENRRLKEAQRMQEERQARRREQEAAEQTRRQAEALRYTQCKDWLHRADDALRNKDLMMEFPAFPRWDCPLTLNERYPCSPSPRLGTCRHRVKALYSVEAELEKALKHTRKKWHPDKFMRCPEGTREDLIASVTEFFQILESLYEEIRSHTS